MISHLQFLVPEILCSGPWNNHIGKALPQQIASIEMETFVCMNFVKLSNIKSSLEFSKVRRLRGNAPFLFPSAGARIGNGPEDLSRFFDSSVKIRA